MPIPRFTQRAIDAINWLVANLDRLKAMVGPDTASRAGSRQAPVPTPKSTVLPSPQPLAMITSIADVAIGYYKVDVYRRDPLFMDPTVRMSSAKLGSSFRSRFAQGYAYTLDEMTATEHLLDVGQVFRCEQVGTHTDGKPVYELIGLPVNIGCDPP